MAGGWGGIRTHGGREPTPVFKTGALNHSATHPMGEAITQAAPQLQTKAELMSNWYAETSVFLFTGSTNSG